MGMLISDLQKEPLLFAFMVMAVLITATSILVCFVVIVKARVDANKYAKRAIKDIMMIRKLSAAVMAGTSKDEDIQIWESAINALNHLPHSDELKDFVNSSNAAYQAYLSRHYPARKDK